MLNGSNPPMGTSGKMNGEGRATLADGPILLGEDGSFKPTVSPAASPSKSARKSPSGKKGKDGSKSPGVFGFSADDTAALVSSPGTLAEDYASKPKAGVIKTKQGASGLHFARTQFFGGGVECLLPTSFEDVSIVRQIPDHQEVYVDKVTEMSFIVELLAFETDVANAAIGEYLFDDLAQCNDAVSKSIDGQEKLVGTDKLVGAGPCYRCQLNGRQVVTTLNQEEGTVADVVQCHLMVLRLPKVGTDVLLTLNFPLAHVKSAAGALELAENAPRESPELTDILAQVVTSFKVNDWSLFA